MNPQSKTTVIIIAVNKWSDTTTVSVGSQISAAHAVAVQIATLCQMDIMSIVPYQEQEDWCVSVVCVNNGRLLSSIINTMTPETDIKSQKYWKIIDIYEWQGLLECVVSVKGSDEKWD
jgi:hypothetical protein